MGLGGGEARIQAVKCVGVASAWICVQLTQTPAGTAIISGAVSAMSGQLNVSRAAGDTESMLDAMMLAAMVLQVCTCVCVLATQSRAVCCWWGSTMCPSRFPPLSITATPPLPGVHLLQHAQHYPQSASLYLSRLSQPSAGPQHFSPAVTCLASM